MVASFAGDFSNYEQIPDMNATLTIEGVDEPTWPPQPLPPTPSTVAQPVPIDFVALASGDGSKWIISVTDAVENCWYSLFETNSLVGGFKIEGIEPVTRRRAAASDVPTMVFERPRTDENVFWRVNAAAEDAHTYPDDEY